MDFEFTPCNEVGVLIIVSLYFCPIIPFLYGAINYNPSNRIIRFFIANLIITAAIPVSYFVLLLIAQCSKSDILEFFEMFNTSYINPIFQLLIVLMIFYISSYTGALIREFSQKIFFKESQNNKPKN